MSSMGVDEWTKVMSDCGVFVVVNVGYCVFVVWICMCYKCHKCEISILVIPYPSARSVCDKFWCQKWDSLGYLG